MPLSQKHSIRGYTVDEARRTASGIVSLRDTSQAARAAAATYYCYYYCC